MKSPVMLCAHKIAEGYYMIRGLPFCCEVKGWNEIPQSAS